MPTDAAHEIAAVAARLVVEEGLEYAVAKRKAAQALGRRGARPSDLPSNEQVEDEVREHLDLFCARTQPTELRALRELARDWMQRLAPFRPHLGGAVWRGTATRLSCILLDLYCDDIKAPEIGLLNQGVDFDAGMLNGRGAEPLSVLSLSAPCPALGERATLHLIVRDHDELRGALKADARGRSWRGDLAALERLLEHA
jgi:hypothetical protein